MHDSGSSKSGGRSKQNHRPMSRQQLTELAEEVATHAEISLALAGIDDRFEAFIEQEASRFEGELGSEEDFIISFRMNEDDEGEEDSSLPVFLSCGADGAIHVMIIDEGGVILQGPKREFSDMGVLVTELREAIVHMQNEHNPVLH